LLAFEEIEKIITAMNLKANPKAEKSRRILKHFTVVKLG
jgi:hypothetical protein